MTMEPPQRVRDLRGGTGALARDMGTTEGRLMALLGNMVLSQMLPDRQSRAAPG